MIMENETEIGEELEEFFERTCITKFGFEKLEPAEFLRMKKKSPLGTYKIKSVELGYFIDSHDQVIIGFVQKGNPIDNQAVTRILAERTRKFSNQKL